MLKGLLIMLLVFLVVGILGWGLTKIGNVAEEKKFRIRKYLFAFYGLFLIAQGGMDIWEKMGIDWMALNIPLGIIIAWAALSGKIDPPSKPNA